MTLTIGSRFRAGTAGIVLVVGMTGCTADEEPPQPTTEAAAPAPAPSDGGGQEGSDPGGADGAPSDDVGEAADPGGEEAECVRQGDLALLEEAPRVDAWEEIDAATVPTSREHGPYVQDGELFTCYEHSATGAVLAAHYVVAAQGVVPGFAEAWIPEGEYRDGVAAREQQPQDEEPTPLTPAGFRMVESSAERAVIDVASEGRTGSGSRLISLRVTLLWDGERWQLDPEAAAEMRPEVLETLDGYIDWNTTQW